MGGGEEGREEEGREGGGREGEKRRRNVYVDQPRRGEGKKGRGRKGVEREVWRAGGGWTVRIWRMMRLPFPNNEL